MVQHREGARRAAAPGWSGEWRRRDGVVSSGTGIEEGDAERAMRKSPRAESNGGRWIGERCVSPLFRVKELCFWRLLKIFGIDDGIGSLLESTSHYLKGSFLVFGERNR